jgi:hypothetical protein
MYDGGGKLNYTVNSGQQRFREAAVQLGERQQASTWQATSIPHPGFRWLESMRLQI